MAAQIMAVLIECKLFGYIGIVGWVNRLLVEKGSYSSSSPSRYVAWHSLLASVLIFSFQLEQRCN